MHQPTSGCHDKCSRPAACKRRHNILNRLQLLPPPACLPTCLTETSKKHFSKAMRELVSKCLVKDPAKRPTAAQVRRCGAQQYP